MGEKKESFMSCTEVYREHIMYTFNVPYKTPSYALQLSTHGEADDLQYNSLLRNEQENYIYHSELLLGEQKN